MKVVSKIPLLLIHKQLCILTLVSQQARFERLCLFSRTFEYPVLLIGQFWDLFNHRKDLLNSTKLVW